MENPFKRSVLSRVGFDFDQETDHFRDGPEKQKIKEAHDQERIPISTIRRG
jgi:hypothetical protein